MNLWRLCFAVEGAVIFDCFAILAATHPHLLESERRYVSITPNARAGLATKPRDVHLLASPESGDKPARAATFYRRPLPEGHSIMLQRLLARCG